MQMRIARCDNIVLKKFSPQSNEKSSFNAQTMHRKNKEEMRGIESLWGKKGTSLFLFKLSIDFILGSRTSAHFNWIDLASFKSQQIQPTKNGIE